METLDVLVAELPDMVVEDVKFVVQRQCRPREPRVCFELWEDGVPCNLECTKDQHAVPS